MAAVTFKAHPYDIDINPLVATGIKLYNKATAELDKSEKLTLNQVNQKQILEQITNDSINFRWGKFVHKVPIGADTNNYLRSLLKQHRDIELEDVQKQAVTTWNNKTRTWDNAVVPVIASRTVQDLTPNVTAAGVENADAPRFYCRVKIQMIATRLLVL